MMVWLIIHASLATKYVYRRRLFIYCNGFIVIMKKIRHQNSGRQTTTRAAGTKVVSAMKKTAHHFSSIISGCNHTRLDFLNNAHVIYLIYEGKPKAWARLTQEAMPSRRLMPREISMATSNNIHPASTTICSHGVIENAAVIYVAASMKACGGRVTAPDSGISSSSQHVSSSCRPQRSTWWLLFSIRASACTRASVLTFEYEIV